MEVVNKVKRTLAGRIYCGFAGGYRAVLGDRWTPLVIREIMVGASVQGVPKAASVLYPRNVHRWPVNAPKDTRGLQFAKSSDAGFRRPVPHRHPFGGLVSHRAGCLTASPASTNESPPLSAIGSTYGRAACWGSALQLDAPDTGDGPGNGEEFNTRGGRTTGPLSVGAVIV